MKAKVSKPKMKWKYTPKGTWQLQSCPICGRKARWGFNEAENGPFIYCENHTQCLTFEVARKTEKEVAERWNKRTGRGNGTHVFKVKTDAGEVLWTVKGLTVKFSASVGFVRKMIAKGLLHPIGGRPYRFTEEEAERFIHSKEGWNAWFDYITR